METQTITDVQDYYGKVLETNEDLKTSACCIAESIPNYIKPILSEVHDEVMEKFYGCGSPIPLALDGLKVLDLGSGSGRDCYVLSKLVGQDGHVLGVDMTDEQLVVANRHVDYHTKKFGFTKPNVEFKKGFIEDLRPIGIKDNSIDLVTSNCVLNLSSSKEKVFSEIFRVLKPGGEMYISDVFSDRRIPAELFDDAVLKGECLSGALYLEDFRRLMYKLGCSDYRVVNQRKLEVDDPEVYAKIGNVNFYSITFRAYKVDLEDRCEDYGQIAIYKGSIDQAPHSFVLDDHHEFFVNKPMLICSNTARMISKTRLSSHFDIIGDESTHFGLFDCLPQNISSGSTDKGAAACC